MTVDGSFKGSTALQNTGDVVGCCVNVDTRQVSFRVNAGAWFGPYTMTGSGAIMPALCTLYSYGSATARFNPASWTQGPIDGSYGPWTL
jgi:hypothetical protein